MPSAFSLSYDRDSCNHLYAFSVQDFFFSFVEDQNLYFVCSCIQIERWIVYKSLSLPNIGLFAEETEQEDTEGRQKHLISNNKV